MNIKKNFLPAIALGLSLFAFAAVTVQAAPGDLDLTFGVGGKVMTQTGYDDAAIATAIQADGKIVVAGERTIGFKHALLGRYNTDGSLDQSFGVGGFVSEAAHGGHLTIYYAVAIQADGKIVAAGFFVETGGCMRHQSWIVRYNADGSRDTTFGGGDGEIENPYLYVNGCPLSSYHYGLAIQTNGKIVVAGSSKNASSNFDLAVARVNTDGSLDTSFNLDGKATFPIGSGNEQAYSVAVNPTTGKIILAGYSYNNLTSDNFAIVMLTASGLNDHSFGNGGKVTTDFVGTDDRANAVVFQKDGKIIAAGQQLTSSTAFDFALARYNSNGTLDPTFDGNGKAGTVFGSYNDIIYGISLQTNGKIVAAGSGRASGDTSDNFAVARYNTNASLNTTFSGDGKLTTDFDGYHDYGRAVAIQADGKIVVAGYASNGSGNDIVLARYEP